MAEATFDATFARNAAESYEENFVPIIGRPVAVRLVEAAELRPGDRVLDVACGTGVVARLATDPVGASGSVTGLDPNPAMLAVAQAVSSTESSIDWRLGPAEVMPLEDDCYDVALCSMGLQFFSNRVAGLAEIRRVLVPGGRVVAGLPGPTPPPLQAMAATLQRHVSPESAGFVHAVFALHEADEIRQLAESAGFARVETRSDETPLELGTPERFLWSYVRSTPLAGALAGLADEARDALERDFAQACAPFLTDGVLKGGVRMTTLIAAT